MAIKRVKCTIEGTSAVLMHKFPMEPIKAIEKKTPEEQAELAAYRDPETDKLYIPGIAIQRSFVGAATYSKGKGRASLQKPVAACVMVSPEYCDLGVKEYKIDSRPIVVPSTRGRVIRHRPRLDTWAVSFEIDYDDELLTETQVRQVVDDAGSRVGLLDFRPERKGPFGRFVVVKWERQ